MYFQRRPRFIPDTIAIGCFYMKYIVPRGQVRIKCAALIAYFAPFLIIIFEFISVPVLRWIGKMNGDKIYGNIVLVVLLK